MLVLIVISDMTLRVGPGPDHILCPENRPENHDTVISIKQKLACRTIVDTRPPPFETRPSDVSTHAFSHPRREMSKTTNARQPRCETTPMRDNQSIQQRLACRTMVYTRSPPFETCPSDCSTHTRIESTTACTFNVRQTSWREDVPHHAHVS